MANATELASVDAPTAAQTMLEKLTDNHIRVAVVGNVDAGNSTFIGTQVSGQLDNGRGSSRSSIMKHKHELESGRTSTVGTHLVCLDKNAQPLIAPSKTTKEGDLVQEATKVVSFIDLGHEKYLKTTIAGISRGMADYAFLLVNGTQPPNHMTLHHLKLCVALNIPTVYCQQIQDIDTVVGKAANMVLTPTISVSCVTGEGLGLLRKLLIALPQRRLHAKKQRHKLSECMIEKIHQVNGVGTVISGFVTRGEWKKGEALHICPLKDGSIFTTIPKSIQVAQTNVDQVWAGHSVCFAIPRPPRNARAMLTNFMVAKKEPITLTKTFEAEVMLVKGKTMTIVKDRAVITAHILHNKQQVRVVDIHDTNGESQEAIRQGDHAKITLQFMRRPQYVRHGMKIILRDGHVRGYGVVTEAGR